MELGLEDLLLRPITASDDAAMAGVIRAVMTSFGACGPGYSIEDPEVDALTAAYAGERSLFLVWVHHRRGEVLGGGGIAPLKGGDAETCELKKMYFLPQAGGRGLGRRMLDRLLAAARERGFRRCYLETLARMQAAARLYERAGFRPLEAPLGATGHFGCDRQYLLRLSP